MVTSEDDQNPVRVSEDLHGQRQTDDATCTLCPIGHRRRRADYRGVVIDSAVRSIIDARWKTQMGGGIVSEWKCAREAVHAAYQAALIGTGWARSVATGSRSKQQT